MRDPSNESGLYPVQRDEDDVPLALLVLGAAVGLIVVIWFMWEWSRQ